MRTFVFWPTTIPEILVAPVISSSTAFWEEGATLSCTTGTWTNSPSSYAYQWLNNGSPLGGFTGTTYALLSTDVSDTITCAVTPSNGFGTGTAAISNSASPILSRRMVPSDISNGIGWYDPNDPTGVVQASGTVSQLTDLSGIGNHMIQGTGARQPAFTANAINTRSALTFSGGQYISASYAITSTQSYTFVGVIIPTSPAAVGRLLSWGASGPDTGSIALRISRATSTAGLSASAGAVGYGEQAAAFDVPHLTMAQRQVAVNFTASVDGAVNSSTTPDAPAGGYTRHTTGVNHQTSGAFGTTYLTGIVGPMAFYNVYLSAANVSIVEGILAWRAGVQSALVAGHPYLTVPPRIP